MKYVTCMVLTGLLVANVAPELPAAEEHAEYEIPMVKPPAKFAALKKLVGKWQADSPPPGQEHGKATVEYSLTSAGTVLVEKLFAGTPHEMISLYHGDGDGIVMTHFCALGNQPRMRLQASDKKNVMHFECDGGTNIRLEKDPHMHSLRMTMGENGKLKHEWTMFAGGKEDHEVILEFTRQTDK